MPRDGDIRYSEADLRVQRFIKAGAGYGEAWNDHWADFSEEETVIWLLGRLAAKLGALPGQRMRPEYLYITGSVCFALGSLISLWGNL